ncbi:alpha/beta hydrolase [Paenibacillus sp. LHD-117]|uniref:alpha/beta fold hydrolase n=1 Tax=Paenibacillus sp. LHD-117 TaxID=3071412 RepID=UPI0027DF5A86|nr:alpha/beta hydrolase [Paenibacillus sp. LHD-117]MDQ6422822.1 alpha/beta hydrolase [Paenibacillus sp. LHD-117]
MNGTQKVADTREVKVKEQEQIGFLFVHGAGLRGNVWRKVAEEIDAPFLLADFPLRDGSELDRKKLGLSQYVQSIKEQLGEWGTRRFIIVAHSIGGVLALKLCDELGDRVAGLAAVGAAIPRDGGSFLSALPLGKRMMFSAILTLAGTKPPEAAIRAGLCNDLAAEQSDQVVRGFLPEAVRLYKERCEAVSPKLPSLYVKLLNDREFPADLQDRMIAGLHEPLVAELNTGHLPMISDPNGVREALVRFRETIPAS